MTSLLRPAVATVGMFTIFLGLAMPVAFTSLAGAVFPAEAGGSLIVQGERVVGSNLIGQNFTAPGYFHARPSETSDGPYNAASSGASQQGATSAALLKAVRERVAAHGGGAVPADAATASGSGLDPHISPENAARQVARVASARNLPAARVTTLVADHTEARLFGLLGEPRVNVLRLNLALDALR